MAITFVGATTAQGSNPQATVPAGTVQGDLMILVTTGGNTSSPAGWTQLAAQGSNQFITILYRFATSSESTVNTGVTATNSRASMLSYRGAGAINSTAGFSNGTGTSTLNSTLTTTYANDFILNIYANQSGAARTWGVPAGTTSRANNSASTTLNGLLIVDESQASIGSNTLRQATINASVAWGTFTFALIETRTVYWVGGSGTWDTSTTTNWSNTSGGAGGVVVPSQNDAVIVDASSGTPTITITGTVNPPACASLTTTGSTCVLTGTGSLSMTGNLTLSATTTWSNSGTLFFLNTATITTNGVAIGNSSSVVFNGVGRTFTLGSALTTPTSASILFVNGTLNLNTFSLSTGTFTSTSATTRSITFGTSSITCTGSGAALFNVVGTLLTYTGTPTVNISNNSATAATITATSFTATNAFDFKVTTGTYTLSVAASSFFKSLDFTGFTGTWTPTAGAGLTTFYGSLTLVDGMTAAANTNTFVFANTAGTATITSAGKTMGPITQNGAGGTVTLGGALTLNITSTFNHVAGFLLLNNFTLTAGFFASIGLAVRSLDAGGIGVITVNGAGGTLFNANSNMSVNGATPTVNVSNNSAVATTITTGTVSSAQALNFNYTTGTYALTDTAAVYNNVNFTGFAGTVTNNARTIYGNWTNPASGITWTAGPSSTTFAATTGTQTITSNAVLLDFPITKTGAGTLVLGGALTIGSTRTFTVSAGTFNPGFDITAGLYSLTAGTVSMTSVTWTATGVGTVWSRTSATISAGTSTIALSNATASAVTFAGGGTVYNNLSLTGVAGTGTVTFTGANTFNTLASSRTGIYIITLPASTTTTVATWSITGSSVSTNYFTLNSSTVGTRATLSVASGTVNPGYAKIQDSATTGGATFTATNASDLGNNTGWTFGTGSRYWVGGTGTWDSTTATNWAQSSSGAGGNFPPTLFEDAFFDGASGSGTVTLTGALTAKSLTTTGSSFTFSSTGSLTVAGNFTLSATTVWSATGTVSFSAIGTVTTNGVVLSSPINGNATGTTTTLGSALTTTGILSLQSGTLALNGFDLSCLTFSGTGTTARGIAFGTNYVNITSTSTATVLDITTATAFTPTGAGGFKLTGAAASSITRTVVVGTTGGAVATAPNVFVSAGAVGSIVAITTGSQLGDLNFTGYTGTFAPAAAYTLYGSLTAVAGMTWTTGTGTITFAATSAGKTITSGGKSLYAVTFNGVGGGWSVNDATIATNTVTLTSGTVTLNGFDLTCLTFSSSNANARAIAFGSNYINITSTNTGVTVLTVQNSTNFTPSGAGGFKMTGVTAASNSKTITVGTTGGSAVTAPNVWIAAGAVNSIVTLTTGSWVRDLNFTGFSGTWDATSISPTITGNLTFVSGMTFTPGASEFVFAGTSGTQTITSAGKSFGNTPLTINNTGTSVQLADQINASAGLTLRSGTFDWNGQPIGVGGIRFSSLTINQTAGLATTIINTASNATYAFSDFIHTAGQFSISSSAPVSCSGSYSFTAGTLVLNNFAFTTSFWNSNNSNTRVIQFGTGSITSTGGGSQGWNMTASGFTYTGSGTINISNNSATANFVTMTGATEINALNFNFTTGTFPLSLTTAATLRSLNFTGFTGSWSPATDTATIYGSITLVSGMTYTAGTGAWTLAATTGTQTITSGGKTLGPITQNGIGGTVAINGALTMASTATYILINGTLDLTNAGTGNYTLTAGLFSSNNTNTRVIAFGTGNITTTGSGTVWNMATSGFTYTGTPTVNISNNSATATTVSMFSSTEANALDFNFTTGTYALTINTSATVRSLNFTGFAGSWSPTTASITFYGSITLVTGMTFTTGTGVWTLAATTGTQTITSAAKTQGPITQAGATAQTVAINGALTMASTATYTLTNGTLDLTNAGTGNYTLTTGLFASNGSTTRAIAFGTGAITTTGSGTVWNTGTVTGFSYTGTPTVNVSNNTATATTVTTGTMTEAQALNFNYTTGTYALTDTSAVYKNINLTGFGGTLPNSARTIYGNWTNPASGITWTAGANAQTFAATTGTQTITSNGVTLDFPITKSNDNSTLTLGSALTIGSTRTFTISLGTFTPGYNITAGLFSLTGTINMGSNTWTASGVGNVWSAAAGVTINTGTSTITFADTTTSTKTFVGSGKTYNNLIIGPATGIASYVITGANTFNTVSSNKTSAYTITLPASTTTTVSNWTAGGAGAYNRLTLNSSTASTQATLALAGSGTAIGGNFMSIQDINFTPEPSGTQPYVWYVGADSTFGTNVTGGALLASDPTLIGYLLTTGTAWTVPADWSSYNNNIYLIGGGGGGSGTFVSAGNGTHASGAGGGGGGFQRASNVALTPGSSVAYAVGAAGTAGVGVSTGSSTAGAGGPTTFNSGAYTAGGGQGGGPTNGSVSTKGVAGTGATANGGAGGNGTGFSNASYAGGGGGGAGGINGAGVDGGSAVTTTVGAGGAGNNNGNSYLSIAPIPYGRGATGAVAAQVSNGITATGYGGGGSGGGTGFGFGNLSNGGAGTQGVIFVLYTKRLAMSNLTFAS
jgi:hypothetical protein